MNIVQRYFEEASEEYQARSGRGLWRWLRTIEASTLTDFLEEVRAAKILELGAGAGFYSAQLLQHGSLTCVDFSPKMLGQLELPVKKICANVEDFSTEEKFDLIFCAGAWEFLPNPKATLHKMAGYLNPGGSIILLTPRKSLGGYLYRWFHRKHRVNVRLFSWARREQEFGLPLERAERVFPFSMVLRFRPGHS